MYFNKTKQTNQTPSIILLLLSVFYLFGCGTQQHQIRVSDGPQMPNIYFKQGDKYVADLTSDSESSSEMKSTLEILMMEPCISANQKWDKQNSSTVKSESFHGLQQASQFSDSVITPTKRKIETVPGLRKSIVGLILNMLVLLAGIGFIIEFGLGFGGSSAGLILIVYLFYGFPVLVYGTVCTISGLRKMRKDKRHKKWLAIPIASLISILGTAFISYLAATPF